MPAGTASSRAFSRPGSGVSLDSLLEQLGGVTQPGPVDVGDRRVDGLHVGGLGDGGEGIQHGGVGLPAPVGIRLDHVGQRAPVSGVCVATGQRREVLDRGRQRGLIQPGPHPFPAAAVLLLQADQRLAGARPPASTPDSSSSFRSSASSASLSWGQNSSAWTEQRPLRRAAWPSCSSASSPG